MKIDFIDWKTVINSLSNGIDILPNPANWNMDTPGYIDIYNKWQECNYNLQAIKWTNFYPGTHFDKNIEIEIAKFLEITPLRSWISKIDPGYSAPWHWDVDDNESEYLTKGELRRYSVFIKKHSPGQAFMLETECFYNKEVGDVVLWEKYNSWHAGFNAGLEPKYMYHILGFVVHG